LDRLCASAQGFEIEPFRKANRAARVSRYHRIIHLPDLDSFDKGGLKGV